MRRFSDYNVVIFDCDGVLMDSNSLKIAAMEQSLVSAGVEPPSVHECVLYFSKNFGKSRYHHVEHFSQNILNIDKVKADLFSQRILDGYSNQCIKLYMEADITPSCLDLLGNSNAIKYVASGSDQEELRTIFDKRELGKYFETIYGSPTAKKTHIKNIIGFNQGKRSVMIGDAISDLEAARDNNIDFIFYSPYSNVESEVRGLCTDNNYRVIDSFLEIIREL